MKRAKDYLPPESEDDRLMQARIPESLFLEVKRFMELEDLTWSEMTIAAFRKFLDDMTKEI